MSPEQRRERANALACANELITGLELYLATPGMSDYMLKVDKSSGLVEGKAMQFLLHAEDFLQRLGVVSHFDIHRKNGRSSARRGGAPKKTGRNVQITMHFHDTACARSGARIALLLLSESLNRAPWLIQLRAMLEQEHVV